MKRSRFTDEQIVRILQETDKDFVAEVAKRHGLSGPSIYAWRTKFGDPGTGARQGSCPMSHAAIASLS